jgi:spermidine/putrescine-binding protein
MANGKPSNLNNQNCFGVPYDWGTEVLTYRSQVHLSLPVSDLANARFSP